MNQEQNKGGVRCHDADACAMGQNPCPTPKFCRCAAPICAVKDGTHKPAEAVHQIAEPAPTESVLIDGTAHVVHADVAAELLRLHIELERWQEEFRNNSPLLAELQRANARVQELEASESRTIAQRDHCEEVIDRMADAVLGKDRHEWTSAYDFMDAAAEVEDQIAYLQSQLEVFGAGGVEPIRNSAAQAVQYAVPDGWKRVPVHPTPDMTKAGDAKTWVLPSKDCWAAMLAAAPAHPAEGVPAQAESKIEDLLALARNMVRTALDADNKTEVQEIKAAIEAEVNFERGLRAALAATQPAAQGDKP